MKASKFYAIIFTIIIFLINLGLHTLTFILSVNDSWAELGYFVFGAFVTLPSIFCLVFIWVWMLLINHFKEKSSISKGITISGLVISALAFIFNLSLAFIYPAQIIAVGSCLVLSIGSVILFIIIINEK